MSQIVLSTPTRFWPFCLLSLVGHMAIAWELWQESSQEDPVLFQGVAVEWVDSSCGKNEEFMLLPPKTQIPQKNDKNVRFIQKPSKTLNKEYQKPASGEKIVSSTSQALCEEHDRGEGEGEEIIPLPGNVAPPYPLEARRKEIEGTIMARLTILSDGSVQKVDIIGEGLRVFRRSVLQTLKTWKFQTRRSSKPLVVEIPIIFSLSSR